MIVIASAVMSLSLAACQVSTSVGTNGEPEEFRQYKTDAINYVEQTYPGMEYKLIKAGYAKVTNMLAPTEDPTKIEYTFENISSGETFVVTCDTYNNRIYDDYTGSQYDYYDDYDDEYSDDYSDSYDDYSDSYDDYSDSYDDYSDSYDDYSDSYDDYSDSYDDYSDSYDDYYNDYDSDYYSDDYNDNYGDYYSDQYYSEEQI